MASIEEDKNLSINKDIDKDIDKGENFKFKDKYVLWCHDIYNKNWNIDGYKKLYTITNISDFWRLYNNFNKLGIHSNHFFLMKNDIEPIWEHVENRNGGVCSIKIELNNSIKLWEDFSIFLICELLCQNSKDVTGISISPKNNWAVIKIWNKDSKIDISKTMHPNVLSKFPDLEFRYKSNAPEY